MTGPAGRINPASVARSSLMSELVSTHVLYTVLSVYSYIFSPALMGWGLSAPKENGWRFLWGSYFCLFLLILVNRVGKCLTGKHLLSVYGSFLLSICFVFLSVCEGNIIFCMLEFNNAVFMQRHTVRHMYKVTGDTTHREINGINSTAHCGGCKYRKVLPFQKKLYVQF